MGCVWHLLSDNGADNTGRDQCDSDIILRALEGEMSAVLQATADTINQQTYCIHYIDWATTKMTVITNYER